MKCQFGCATYLIAFSHVFGSKHKLTLSLLFYSRLPTVFNVSPPTTLPIQLFLHNNLSSIILPNLLSSLLSSLFNLGELLTHSFTRPKVVSFTLLYIPLNSTHHFYSVLSLLLSSYPYIKNIHSSHYFYLIIGPFIFSSIKLFHSSVKNHLRPILHLIS